MNAPEDDEEAIAMGQLTHFLEMSIADPQEGKRLKVQYEGKRFFGSIYMLPETLQKALK